VKNVLGIAIVLFFISAGFAQAENRTTDDISLLISKLQSREKVVKENAKQELIKIGKKSAPQLIDSLKNIANDPCTVYQTWEGRCEALYLLNDDIVDILAEIGAEDVVPFILRQTLHYSLSFGPSGELGMPYYNLLTKMGATAIPQLIRVLDEPAFIIKQTVNLDNPLYETQTNALTQGLPLIQNRIVLIFQEIGDERTIPSLERFKIVRKDMRQMVEVIENTIDIIRARTGKK
jgi:hypothetical protein